MYIQIKALEKENLNQKKLFKNIALQIFKELNSEKAQ
jgi:hypothetical protein